MKLTGHVIGLMCHLPMEHAKVLAVQILRLRIHSRGGGDKDISLNVSNNRGH